MSETEHTPGPWSVDPEATTDGWRITAFQGPLQVSPGLSPSLPDAFLIAAAPDLFDACAEFVRKVECGEARSKRSYQQMKTALAKARGEHS